MIAVDDYSLKCVNKKKISILFGDDKIQFEKKLQ